MNDATATPKPLPKGTQQTPRIAVNDAPAILQSLVMAGWTGRNAAELEAHIRELEALGVPRPEATPIYFRLPVSLLTQDEGIQVSGAATSGEAEPVLLNLGGQIWVGVGSDHTDRTVEAYDIPVSKQVCAKPIGSVFWPFEEVADHWDSIVLRSFAHEGAARTLYQEGEVAGIRRPEDLLSRYAAKGAGLQPAGLMFCGTIAVQGDLRFADAFTVELEDPVRRRNIRHTYAVESLAG